MKKAIVLGVIVGVVIGLALLVVEARAQGLPECDDISLDGDPVEWVGAESFALMYQAGKPDKPIVGEFYYRRCDSYAHGAVILYEPHILDQSNDDNWIKIGGVKVAGGGGPTFEYFQQGNVQGWEALWPFVEGEIRAHALYDGGETAQTLPRPTAIDMVALAADSSASPIKSWPLLGIAILGLITAYALWRQYRKIED